MANFHTDEHIMSPAFKGFVHSMLTREIENAVSQTTGWTPPSFEESFNYCQSNCKRKIGPVPFGHFNNIKLEAVFCGRVECWGNGGTDLTDEGLLELVLAPNVHQLIPVFVVGHIVNTETAMLLDEQSNVWFIVPRTRLMVSSVSPVRGRRW